jgi:hypothetical protein
MLINVGSAHIFTHFDSSNTGLPSTMFHVPAVLQRFFVIILRTLKIMLKYNSIGVRGSVVG